MLAGTAYMNFLRFNIYNLIGSFLWVWLLIPIGYFLGRQFPELIPHIEYSILAMLIILISIMIRGAIKLKKKPGSL